LTAAFQLLLTPPPSLLKFVLTAVSPFEQPPTLPSPLPQTLIELVREPTPGGAYAMRARRGPLWWAAIERPKWPSGLDAEIAPLWDETWGDRQVELEIITVTSSARLAAERALQGSLLTAIEAEGGVDAWCEMEDPLWDEERRQVSYPFSPICHTPLFPICTGFFFSISQ